MPALRRVPSTSRVSGPKTGINVSSLRCGRLTLLTTSTLQQNVRFSPARLSDSRHFGNRLAEIPLPV
jgi:hypothetical protein